MSEQQEQTAIPPKPEEAPPVPAQSQSAEAQQQSAQEHEQEQSAQPPSHPVPAEPHPVPAEPHAIPPQPEAPVPPVRKDRRALRAALRWTAAVVVFAVVGAGTAYGITQMKRSDVPGLSTESDGRWDYPEITRPSLPSGSPGPFARDNKAGAHYADLRALLLPAPKGAKADAALSGTDGWLATKDFLAQYASADDRKAFGQKLTDYGLRHIAARGWTAADGTRTRIYLLQFGTAAVVDQLFSPGLISYDSPVYPLSGAQVADYDDSLPGGARSEKVTVSAYAEPKPYGAEQVRLAYLSAGDTLGLVVQSRRGGALAVPFQQTLALESQLLD